MGFANDNLNVIRAINSKKVNVVNTNNEIMKKPQVKCSLLENQELVKLIIANTRKELIEEFGKMLDEFNSIEFNTKEDFEIAYSFILELRKGLNKHYLSSTSINQRSKKIK